MKQEECPVSLISRYPQMDTLVDEITHMDWVREGTGAVAFGPNTSKWPARWFDVVFLAQIENSKIESARQEVRERERVNQ